VPAGAKMTDLLPSLPLRVMVDWPVGEDPNPLKSTFVSAANGIIVYITSYRE